MLKVSHSYGIPAPLKSGQNDFDSYVITSQNNSRNLAIIYTIEQKGGN